ncbi:ribose-5-phosphate isomerase [Granulicella pectinivorans]|jgi:ribose 5-phosphate isomerase A|uniref:Ribose-5-phosphate isomerase A n=1 Tax=Granulicella pectinivorans TaxID=474950 RepID=A0A1I6LSV2_9BACT|nr:ribose-5-phosphate isomerase RpiA [Granulicella pectinivorans]SFS06504.1 ribose-5-phosphate isomerase [Granulicella pectinivorans]
MTQDEAKKLVGLRAAEFVEEGMAVGLGTGTTSVQFIHALGERVRGGLKISCVASSESSHKLAASLGIPVTTLPELPELDLYIDGADEVAPGLALIKGGGGALLREKIVASAAKKFIVVADSTKIVEHLGRFPLPIEVIQMAMPLVVRKLAAIGLEGKLRHTKEGNIRMTDEGNYILDCACGEIPDPERLAAQIRSIVGVVEHGLFLNMAAFALIAGEDGVRELHP